MEPVQQQLHVHSTSTTNQQKSAILPTHSIICTPARGAIVVVVVIDVYKKEKKESTTAGLEPAPPKGFDIIDIEVHP
jgi:hypothetical protein